MDVYSEPQHVTARVGEQFAIELPCNATAGYQWFVETDEELIRVVDQAYRPHKDAIGSAGVERIVFWPLAASTGCKIRCICRQAWEDPQNTADERIVTVEVI